MCYAFVHDIRMLQHATQGKQISKQETEFNQMKGPFNLKAGNKAYFAFMMAAA
jgi:hypothetical protein